MHAVDGGVALKIGERPSVPKTFDSRLGCDPHAAGVDGACQRIGQDRRLGFMPTTQTSEPPAIHSLREGPASTISRNIGWMAMVGMKLALRRRDGVVVDVLSNGMQAKRGHPWLRGDSVSLSVRATRARTAGL